MKEWIRNTINIVRCKLIRMLGGSNIPVKVEDSNLLVHARTELDLVLGPDEMDQRMRNNILDIISVFAAQGHSGFSAGICISWTKWLMNFEPLTPLTGKEEEWGYLGYTPEMESQNKRDSRVFRREDGSAYFIEGRIFREPNGICYTGRGSLVEIDEFPYTPESEFVDVNEEGEVIDND